MTNLKRAYKTAGNRRRKRGLIFVSCLLSSLGAVCMLVPYASMYFILKELLEHSAPPVLAGGAEMIRWGVIALLSFAAGLIMMYAYDSLERMNASAVQYVRGMPAVKVFGQTVQSFHQFHIHDPESTDDARGSDRPDKDVESGFLTRLCK
ncbi:hypothetical protein PVOR_19144 [Paenibacillus vortex V453]|uniref:Uncharacterized protein n=1 Tax=Paenibacillus vortex V453 TaxID=715225 RepID=A0A2R9ST41_9BACL|nr:hypothetical protein PVOR_19144 [Paenibacillus vortex V453]